VSKFSVLGVDLSLTSTGLAQVTIFNESGGYPGGPGLYLKQVQPRKYKGLDRLRFLRDSVVESSLSVNVMVIEGPSYGSQSSQSGHHERAGLWWMVVEAVDSQSIPWVQIAPTALKKFATGKGNANKDTVLAAVIHRYGGLVEVTGNDVADALVLAAMACHHYQVPLLPVPKINSDALAKPEWPRLQDAA